jgi:hypothetical protein
MTTSHRYTPSSSAFFRAKQVQAVITRAKGILKRRVCQRVLLQCRCDRFVYSRVWVCAGLVRVERQIHAADIEHLHLHERQRVQDRHVEVRCHVHQRLGVTEHTQPAGLAIRCQGQRVKRKKPHDSPGHPARHTRRWTQSTPYHPPQRSRACD